MKKHIIIPLIIILVLFAQFFYLNNLIKNVSEEIAILRIDMAVLKSKILALDNNETVSDNGNKSVDNLLKPPEEKWENYTSSQLGFSIKYPEMVYGVYRCFPDKPFYVPLKVFEDIENGIVYLTEEYYYDNWSSESQNDTGPCKKIINSLESLQKERERIIDVNNKVSLHSNPFLTRVFVVKKIKSDSELNNFVKDTYGQGCFVENKTPWKQDAEVYEIEIKGEDWDKGVDLGDTTCFIHSTYKFLYSPKRNKAISVNLGQECGFSTDYNNSQSYKCYDEEMVNSISFE